jgi:hypothetical protein
MSTFLSPTLRAAASEVATLLKERNETISVAETVCEISKLCHARKLRESNAMVL